MKTKKQIVEKIKNIQKWLDTTSSKAMLTEETRITYAGSSGAVEILKWVLDEEQ